MSFRQRSGQVKEVLSAGVVEPGYRHGTSLFREAYVEEKAQPVESKATASRTPRPHTKYTPAQAARGRQVALIRKKGATDLRAAAANAGPGRQADRDRGGTRLHSAHGFQPEQAAISEASWASSWVFPLGGNTVKALLLVLKNKMYSSQKS